MYSIVLRKFHNHCNEQTKNLIGFFQLIQSFDFWNFDFEEIIKYIIEIN